MTFGNMQEEENTVRCNVDEKLLTDQQDFQHHSDASQPHAVIRSNGWFANIQ